jgi:hypothetical protein
MPFAWLTVSWLVAVPLAIYFQNGMPMRLGTEIGAGYGDDWVLRDHFLETIVAYVLNLGCAIWLLDQDGSTRWAAFWSLLLGIGRIVVPIALVTQADIAIANGQHYIDWHMLRIVVWFADIQMLVLGLMTWIVFARFVGETNGAADHAGHAVHAEAY